MARLRCEALVKSFDGVKALADVHIEFPSTGVVAIIGPNGAGKTTLLNVLTGFASPASGRCFFGAADLTGLAPYRISRLGIARTFQDVRLVMQVSVLENVLLARPNQRGERLLGALLRLGVSEEEENRAEAIRLLRLTGLEAKLAEKAGDLSYGQQKLLSLACCLATEARVLLLDEPVAGVHPLLVAQIVELLGELRRTGKLVVFIEHDLGVVRQLADTVIVMDRGRVIAHGAPREVLERPEIMDAYLA